MKKLKDLSVFRSIPDICPESFGTMNYYLRRSRKEYAIRSLYFEKKVRQLLYTSLITEVPDTGIRVSWEMDRYDVIDLQGNIIAEELTEEGTVVQLKAILTYEGRQQVCEFGVRVLPQILGEEEELTALRTKYQNAEKILGGLKTVRDALLSDGGAADAVNTAHRGLLSIVRYGDYDALSERLENALAELEDIGETAESLAEELDIDEREAERVENRLDEIRSLKKKYGGSVEEALSFLARAREELSLLENSAEECEKLRVRLENNSGLLYAACRKLTELRKAGAEGFTERVVGELRTLNIPSARFEIAFEPYSEEDLPRVNSDGLDRVRFLFSANAGEPPKELGKIISGGEMSRFMLAVKAQLSSLGSIGTYIFDEIDAGIGGKTARVVAEKFADIAKTTQIIAVSHLAQIAAFADRQFLIEKKEEGGRTFSRIRLLGEEERREELVRLLGGDRSESALRHADELLESARAYKSETNGKPVGR